MENEVSKKQLEANKENAQVSTGPKTGEGKAISRYNALKHGLLSKEVLLEGEDEELLLKMGKRLREELQPVGEMETLLVDRITTNTWRLRRAIEVEKNSMEWQKEYEAIDFDPMGTSRYNESQTKRKKVVRMIVNSDNEQILRYETTIERSIYRALHELQRLQAARKGDRPPAPLAVDIDISNSNE